MKLKWDETNENIASKQRLDETDENVDDRTRSETKAMKVGYLQLKHEMRLN